MYGKRVLWSSGVVGSVLYGSIVGRMACCVEGVEGKDEARGREVVESRKYAILMYNHVFMQDVIIL